jgi:5-hydroxyisourate hydrolase
LGLVKLENWNAFSKKSECTLDLNKLSPPLIKVHVYQAILGVSAMAGFLTTHVLDTARGCPAAGLAIELFRIEGEKRTSLRKLVTNADGRTDEQILPAAEFELGTYELVFHCGAYLDACGVAAESPRFLDVVPLRFGMSEHAHYHVPLLLSPFGYSTYRGS